MLQRLPIASAFALLASVGTTASAFAAQGPDAGEVALGTFLVVLGSMAVLFLLSVVRAAVGGATMPSDEEPHAGDHQ